MIFFNRAQNAGFVLPNFKNEGTCFVNTECLILDGKKVSENIVQQCHEIFSRAAMKPHLAVILVGDNPASLVYVKNKLKIFEKASFRSTLCAFSQEDATHEKILHRIHELNDNNNVHGILLQLPLPNHLSSEKILKEISFKKDVDGFSAENIGLLALNDPAGITACTPFGIMILLSAYGINPAGKNCVVVGRSAIVGKPMGLLLLNANATVTFVHSQTKDMHAYTREADILIVATGKKHLIDKRHIKTGSVVIDVGIHKNADSTLSGDVHPNVSEKASALSPVPGGVGPLTIAALLMNTAMIS